jgi:dTDP-4-dehydrorhamnose 3,5-epimerase
MTSLKITETDLPGVLLLGPEIFRDPRGFLLEAYHAERYAEAGVDRRFVQDNRVWSRRGVVRGLHYQLRRPQGKLIYPVTGEIFDVAVDIRKGSPFFGRWFGARLSADECILMFIPEGFAHGYCVVSESAEVIYKCTDFYDPGDSHGILWDDPQIGIQWPVQEPVLSEQDRRCPLLGELSEGDLPVYSPS